MADGADQKAAGPAAGKQRPTLKTIAYMTGLGVTTVSRALKDAPDIGTQTKERVRLVARQLGYRPNRAGVRLRTGKTNVIALVLSIDEEIMGFSSQMVFGITEALSDTPYHLILTPHSHSKDPLVPVRYILETGSADGVIISRIEPNDPRIRLLQEENMPFAAHGRTDCGIVHAYHDFDNEAFSYEAVRRLVQERGRKRIALLQPPHKLSYHHHMVAGFRRGLQDFGAEAVEFDVTIDSPLPDIRDAVERLMRSPNAPDGLISSAGSATIAVNGGVEAAGKHIGRDIDVVSKQSTPILHWVRPEIITAFEDVREAGAKLAEALIARIEGAPPETLQSMSEPNWEMPA